MSSVNIIPSLNWYAAFIAGSAGSSVAGAASDVSSTAAGAEMLKASPVLSTAVTARPADDIAATVVSIAEAVPKAFVIVADRADASSAVSASTVKATTISDAASVVRPRRPPSPALRAGVVDPSSSVTRSRDRRRRRLATSVTLSTTIRSLRTPRIAPMASLNAAFSAFPNCAAEYPKSDTEAATDAGIMGSGASGAGGAGATSEALEPAYMSNTMPSGSRVAIEPERWQ